MMQKPYPAVRFVVQHGARVAWVVPAVVAAAGLAGAVLQSSVWCAAAGIVGGVLLFCLLRVFVELVQIIAETLLPQ